MPDPTTPTAPVTTATEAVIAHAAAEKALIEKLIADYKARGFAGLTADIPDVIADVEADIPLVKAAIPEIRAGYKTTEFWLVVGVVLGNTIYALVTGHAFPVETNAVLVAVTGIYTVVRSIIKGRAATA